MSLTKDQLLIPRVMCVGTQPGTINYPDSEFVTGEILMFGKSLTHSGDEIINDNGCFWKQDQSAYISKRYAEAFPHLFRPMPWWEGRNPEDMPKWVKFSENYMNFKAGSVYETECWSDKHYDCIQFRSEEGLCGVPFGKWVAPATEQEYWDSKPLRKCPDCGSEWKGNDSCPECFPI